MRIGFRREEVRAKMKGFCVWLLVLVPFCCPWLSGYAEGCPACWAGYGSGDERFNKPLADLKILYEKNGKTALPAIREAVRTHIDPMVKKRAIAYLLEMNDVESIPLLEDMLAELLKRVSFSSFGTDSIDFQTRLRISHALAKLGAKGFADRIWERYYRLDQPRKAEVPYLLNALEDPRLTDRLLEVLKRGEDHQLMLGAIEVLGMGADAKGLSFLRSKMIEWERKNLEPRESTDPPDPLIYYSVLRIKAEQACFSIEERRKGAPPTK
ncbi:MAG: HEAT repeat domain-containing protein [Thermodesulfobacteriota bacterium]|nr:HEAT repeat domain-containing protein [Thermodesulfobacteriota bacterium]